jgi:hypothetical protein
MTTRNQEVFAKMAATMAIAQAARVDRRTPHEHLVDSLQEAVRDARAGCSVLEEAGMADCTEYLLLRSRVSRWEAALRMNR